MRKILAIVANTSPTRYVTETSRRFDGKLTVVTTENKNEARDFGDVVSAKSVIEKFFNPFDRVYKPAQIEVALPASFDDGFFNQERRIS